MHEVACQQEAGLGRADAGAQGGLAGAEGGAVLADEEALLDDVGGAGLGIEVVQGR